MTRRLLTLVAAFSLAATAFAADATIDGVRLGDSIAGNKPSADEMKGRVVFVEKWGIH